jgi:hypothetical protein
MPDQSVLTPQFHDLIKTTARRIRENYEEGNIDRAKHFYSTFINTFNDRTDYSLEIVEKLNNELGDLLPRVQELPITGGRRKSRRQIRRQSRKRQSRKRQSRKYK